MTSDVRSVFTQSFEAYFQNKIDSSKGKSILQPGQILASAIENIKAGQRLSYFEDTNQEIKFDNHDGFILLKRKSLSRKSSFSSKSSSSTLSRKPGLLANSSQSTANLPTLDFSVLAGMEAHHKSRSSHTPEKEEKPRRRALLRKQSSRFLRKVTTSKTLEEKFCRVLNFLEEHPAQMTGRQINDFLTDIESYGGKKSWLPVLSAIRNDLINLSDGSTASSSANPSKLTATQNLLNKNIRVNDTAERSETLTKSSPAESATATIVPAEKSQSNAVQNNTATKITTETSPTPSPAETAPPAIMAPTEAPLDEQCIALIRRCQNIIYNRTKPSDSVRDLILNSRVVINKLSEHLKPANHNVQTIIKTFGDILTHYEEGANKTGEVHFDEDSELQSLKEPLKRINADKQIFKKPSAIQNIQGALGSRIDEADGQVYVNEQKKKQTYDAFAYFADHHANNAIETAKQVAAVASMGFVKKGVLAVGGGIITLLGGAAILPEFGITAASIGAFITANALTFGIAGGVSVGVFAIFAGVKLYEKKAQQKKLIKAKDEIAENLKEAEINNNEPVSEEEHLDKAAMIIATAVKRLPYSKKYKKILACIKTFSKQYSLYKQNETPGNFNLSVWCLEEINKVDKGLLPHDRLHTLTVGAHQLVKKQQGALKEFTKIIVQKQPQNVGRSQNSSRLTKLLNNISRPRGWQRANPVPVTQTSNGLFNSIEPANDEGARNHDAEPPASLAKK